MEIFPFKIQQSSIETIDFSLFFHAFRQYILDRIPTAGNVVFLSSPEPVLSGINEQKHRKAFAGIYKKLKTQREGAAVASNLILMCFPLPSSGSQMACVTGLDELVVQRIGQDWLQDTYLEILGQFKQLKSAFFDWETGLPNWPYFQSCLEKEGGDSTAVILVELPPRRKSAKECFRHSRKAALVLASLSDEHTILSHLGQCIFGMYLTKSDSERTRIFVNRLVRLLKNEGFPRVHIGFQAALQKTCEQDTQQHENGLSLLNASWTALQEASKRGPFSFCEYQSLRELSTSKQLPQRLVQRILAKSQLAQRFTIFNISSAQSSMAELRVAVIKNMPKKALMFADGNHVVLLLADCSTTAAEKHVRALLSRFSQEMPDVPVHIGISIFPFKQYRRAQIIHNSQKALQHSRLLGAGTYAICDAVSCNICGDSLFGEGDLPGAVREYRLGLEIDPKNINLLNSLGVTYALLDRDSDARISFEQVLQLAPDDPMAMYNLGLIAKNLGEYAHAITYFEQAARFYNTSGEDAHIGLDLQLQLGILCCHTKQYESALNYLQMWFEQCPSETKKQRNLRFLGEAQYACGLAGDAMNTLQHAINVDSYDYQALSLLGMIILQKNEGKEIALSLCRKSVELEPGSPLLLLRLAQAELQCEHFDLALQYCRKLLHVKEFQLEVCTMLTEIYARKGNVRLSRHWQTRTEVAQSQIINN